MKGHLWSCFFTSLIPIGTALLTNVNSKISITTLVTRKRSILMIIMVLSKTVWDLSFGLKNKSLFSQKKRDLFKIVIATKQLKEISYAY